MEETRQNTGDFVAAPQPIPTYIVQRRNGLGTAGFVLALLAVIFSWIPVVNIILWLLGLIFSLVGLRRAPRGLAIAGIILALVAILFIIIFSISWLSAAGSIFGRSVLYDI